MKVNIVRAIAEVLDARNPVFFAGLGSVYMDNLPARVDDASQKITPPQTKLSLYQTENDNKALKKLLKRRYQLNEKKVNKLLKDYNESLVNTLFNYGEAKVEGVMKFSQKEGSIALVAEEAFMRKYNEGWPVVKLPSQKEANKDQKRNGQKESDAAALPTQKNDIPSTLSANKAQISTVPKSTSSPKADVKPSVKAEVGTGQVQKASSVVASPTVHEKLMEKKQISLSTTQDKSNRENIQSSINTAIQKAKQDFAEPAPLVYKQDDGFDFMGCIIPILSALLLILLCMFLWKSCNRYMDASKLDKSNAMVQDSLDGKGVDSLFSSAYEQDQEEGASQVSECIIITGVFTKYRNLDRMKNRLAQAGYTVYQENTDEGTRIGFKFDCSNEDLETYLRNVRAQFAVKSWYLKPDLYVEYQ